MYLSASETILFGLRELDLLLAAVVVSVVAMLLSAYTSIKASKIDYESTSEWRKGLMDIAGSNNVKNETKRQNYNSKLIKLRGYVRYDKRYGNEKNFIIENRVIDLYEERIINGKNNSVSEAEIEEIRNIARMYLKIDWEVNQSQTLPKHILIFFNHFFKSIFSFSRRARKNLKHQYFHEFYGKEFDKQKRKENE